MSGRTNRRTFLKASTAAGIGYWAAGGVSASPRRSAIEEIRFGCIGVDGKGSSDSADAHKPDRGRKVVAMCDIDETRRAKKRTAFGGAAEFSDYRKMLEKMGDSIDAVTVSTPDHTHAPAALMAMRMGKHCFCQKPMTHSIYEARLMAETAKKMDLVTQMGNQGTAETTLRTSAALIQSGAIGDVTEVHIWTNRPVWPQGDIEVKREAAPDAVDWESWIGPAEYEEYSPEIHPFKWRGFWKFGTGALGDMACHTLNMSFMALDLKDPVSVQAETSGHNKVMYPGWSVIDYQFPDTSMRKGVTMRWYDGGKKPPAELLAGLPNAGNGRPYNSAALVVGTKGKLYSPGDYGGDGNNTGLLIDGEFTQQRRFVRRNPVEIVESPGHFEEFARAIAGEGEAVSNFQNYAGALTETVLLGNLAVWVDGDKVDWNAKDLTASIDGSPVSSEVEEIIKPIYREGHILDV